MDSARALRHARRRASLSQAALAERAGTSQATISAYESGRKIPSVETFSRLLAATGSRLAVERATRPVVTPSPEQLAKVDRGLRDVLALAEALPSRPSRELRFPRLPVARHDASAEAPRAPPRTCTAELPHAFGGAIALAYCTLDPRGTSDIDVNVFIPATDAARALSALPRSVAVSPGAAEAIARDGQIRLWWDETPVDLFFDYEAVHEDAARHVRSVPFEGEQIPVLGPVELAAFKAMFDRTRDWADIEAMFAAGTLDVDALKETLLTMLPPDDERMVRLDEALRRAG